MPHDIISLYRAKLAKEKGTIRKDWGGKLSIALTYPNLYRLGMSNLGFQIVYDLLNKRSDVVAERVFLPEEEEISIYLSTSTGLLSLESQTPVKNFDLIAFSLSFENDYLNILKILELARVPLLSEERPGPCPFIIAGGITTFLNPEPLASFIDFFWLGEAEANLNEFINLFLDIRHRCAKRTDVTYNLARNLPNVYVPSLYQPEYHKDGTIKSFLPKQALVPTRIKAVYSTTGGFLDEHEPKSNITTPDTEFANKILVEIGRGCGRSCRFCAGGYVYRPPRPYQTSELRKSIENALGTCGQVGLLASAVSDVPGIEDLTSLIINSGGRFSISSLRADSLTQTLLKNLKQAKQKALAIAPEAGSERLRRVVNKHLTKKQIIKAARLISKVEGFSIRLYFLIGLPSETREDVSEIVNLVKVIKHNMVKESAPRGKIGQIKLSVNCFIPKPFTPFQWFPLDQLSSLKDKQRSLKKALGKEGGIKVNFDIPKWAYVQTLLSMGDRRVGSILLMSHKFGGDWKKAIHFSDINPDFFVYRPKGLDEILPWNFIDNGILNKHLINEYKLALKGEESDICHVGECVRCGVCG